jgi:hypothetical protein
MFESGIYRRNTLYLCGKAGNDYEFEKKDEGIVNGMLPKTQYGK